MRLERLGHMLSCQSLCFFRASDGELLVKGAGRQRSVPRLVAQQVSAACEARVANPEASVRVAHGEDVPLRECSQLSSPDQRK